MTTERNTYIPVAYAFIDARSKFTDLFDEDGMSSDPDETSRDMIFDYDKAYFNKWEQQHDVVTNHDFAGCPLYLGISALI